MTPNDRCWRTTCCDGQCDRSVPSAPEGRSRGRRPARRRIRSRAGLRAQGGVRSVATGREGTDDRGSPARFGHTVRRRVQTPPCRARPDAASACSRDRVPSLNRDVAEERRDLSQFAAGQMTQPGTGPPEIVRRQLLDTRTAGGATDEVPEHVRLHPSPHTDPLCSSRERRRRASGQLSNPVVDGGLHPTRVSGPSGCGRPD